MRVCPFLPHVPAANPFPEAQSKCWPATKKIPLPRPDVCIPMA